jgi:hypothetical protein
LPCLKQLLADEGCDAITPLDYLDPVRRVVRIFALPGEPELEEDLLGADIHYRGDTEISLERGASILPERGIHPLKGLKQGALAGAVLSQDEIEGPQWHGFRLERSFEALKLDALEVKSWECFGLGFLGHG